MTDRARIWPAIVAVVLSLALVLAGQSMADVAAPSAPSGALTGQAVGRAGFAYFTGLRKFAAALLWNRLDPQLHEYYGGVGLGKMGFMLPSIKAVVTLDPQFVEAYYVAPAILIQTGQEPGVSAEVAAERLKLGLDLAREGALNNPKSGIAVASYAELLYTFGKDLKAALPYAEAAIADDMVWRSDEEQWDAFAIMKAIFTKAGDTARVAQVQAVMDAIDANPNATKNPVDKDE